MLIGSQLKLPYCGCWTQCSTWCYRLVSSSL